MKAYVYRSAKRADTYVYLRRADDFSALPPPLAERLGALTQVMELELSPDRRLARADVAVVREQLERTGYFLQLPPVAEDLARDRR